MGNGLTDAEVKSAFTAACSFADKVQLVKIPSDFVAEKYADSVMVRLVGELNLYDGVNVEKYLKNLDNNNADLIKIDSPGGKVGGAISIVNAMSNRHEDILVTDRAYSAASAIMAHGDNVYASKTSRVMTHQTRIESASDLPDPEQEAIMKNLLGDGPYFEQGFEVVAKTIRADDPDNQQLAQELGRIADWLQGQNLFMSKAYEAAHDSITMDCATSMVSENDLFLSAEEATQLGLVGAVLLNEDTMLVRESDPRAIDYKKLKPDAYADLNPEQTALAPTHEGVSLDGRKPMSPPP